MDQQLDETSRALLVAAHRLLAEHGSDALTVRRMAAEAGMSTMNVYSRFGGKDGVVDVLYIDGFERLFAAIGAVPTTDHIPDDLMETARVYRTFALENPTYYRVMFRSAIHDFTPSDRATEVALSGLGLFAERLRAGQASGDVVDGEHQSATDLAAFLWATCHGLVSLELFGVARERVDWPAVFDNGMRTAIGGLHPSVRHLVD